MAKNLRNIIDDAYTYGKITYSPFRRVYPYAAVAGYWIDLSMATGFPPPNYYLGDPLMATIPNEWYKKGIWHGGAVSPEKKYLHKINIFCGTAAGAPAPYTLCDYLMYYPIIDMDSTDEQFFTNYGPVLSDTLFTDPSAAALPRYTDGVGVQAFLVATNPYVGGAMFQIKYTNTLNQTNRLSKMTVANTSTNIGTLVNSHTAGVQQYGAFIQLQTGDQGIKSVQSITVQSPNGGLACLVLCHPIVTVMTKGTDAWCEFDFIRTRPFLPRIYDDAYLNLLAMPSATMAAIPVIGELTTIWGA